MEDLKSGIEHLKQAKAHMSKANGIMSNCISKLKSLEEENGRAERRSSAPLQIQPDASYMKLPVDADGRGRFESAMRWTLMARLQWLRGTRSATKATSCSSSR